MQLVEELDLGSLEPLKLYVTPADIVERARLAILSSIGAAGCL
jgi:hypothetical protein